MMSTISEYDVATYVYMVVVFKQDSKYVSITISICPHWDSGLRMPDDTFTLALSSESVH